MSEYVTNETWAQALGRADAIDDIADQFERPADTHPRVVTSGREWSATPDH